MKAKVFKQGSPGAKVVSALSAAALTLALTPAFAAGDPTVYTEGTKGSLTISSLAAGDKVDLYKFVNTTYTTSSNSLKSEFVSGVDYNGDTDGNGFADYAAVAGDFDENGNPIYKPLSATQTTATDAQQAADKIAQSVLKSVSGISVTKTATVAESATSVTLSDLDLGQYLVVVTPGASSTGNVYQNTIASIIPSPIENSTSYELKNVAFNVKKTEITVDKKASSDADSTTGYQLGDSVPFTVEVLVPTYPDGATNKTLTVSDKMSTGLTLQTTSNGDVADVATDTFLTVKSGETAIDSGAYSITAGSGDYEGGFTVTFNYDQIKNYANQKLTLSYNAKVVDAIKDVASGTASNKAKATFANYPYVDSSSTTGTTEDKVDVNTYGVYLMKLAADNGSGTPLAGAEFTIYDTENHAIGSTSTTTLVGDGGNQKAYAYFYGLKAGQKYTIKETKVPAGYQAVEDSEITITAPSGETPATATIKLANGTETSNVTLKSDNPATSSLTETNYFELGTLTDPQEIVLPVTGGAGIMGITAVGVLLVAGGAYLLVRSRRNDA